jgi:hypothetical protein
MPLFFVLLCKLLYNYAVVFLERNRVLRISPIVSRLPRLHKMSRNPAACLSRSPSESRSPTPDSSSKAWIPSPEEAIEKLTQVLNSFKISSAWKHLRKSNKKASAFETYNAEFAPIYILPPEVVDRVVQYLSTADIMSLRLVSRRFFWRTQRQKSTWSDQRDFKARLQFDTYTKLAKAEPTDIGKLSKLVCSFCHDTHPRRAFDHKEAIKSPYGRQCHGSSRHFRVCDHMSRDRTSIKDIRSGTPGSGLCVICKIWFYISRFNSISDMMYWAERQLEYSHMSRIITRAEIKVGLKQLAMPVCPHMRTNDAYFLDRVLTNTRGTLWNHYNNGRPLDGLFADSYEISCISIPCPNQRCNTACEIERKVGVGGVWPIQVRLRRNLGLMKDVLDPKWVIQLEKPDS